MIDPTYLLDDAAMKDFIVRGYVNVETDFPPEFHERIYQDIEKVRAAEGNVGNQILERVPALQEVYDHPAVRGALTSVLGRDYVMHRHRHCHTNPPGSPGGRWHQDDVNVRHHQIWRVLAMYYPQDVTEEMGPTVILPGTQFRNAPTTRMASYVNFKSQVPLTVKAGTVAITHYDIWHTNMPNRSQKTRHMLKFLFDRTCEPDAPSWRADPALREEMNVQFIRSGLPIDSASDAYKHRVTWMAVWKWLCGVRDGEEATIVTYYP
jgi:hypothetical protein